MFVTGLIPSSFTVVPILPSVFSFPSGLRATAFLPDVTQRPSHWVPGQYGVRHPINIADLLTKTDSIITSILLVIPAVSSVAKRTLSVREVRGSIPGPVKSAQCRQRLATAATFLRSCATQALSRGDGPRNSLHASA